MRKRSYGKSNIKIKNIIWDELAHQSFYKIINKLEMKKSLIYRRQGDNSRDIWLCHLLSATLLRQIRWLILFVEVLGFILHKFAKWISKEINIKNKEFASIWLSYYIFFYMYLLCIYCVYFCTSTVSRKDIVFACFVYFYKDA